MTGCARMVGVLAVTLAASAGCAGAGGRPANAPGQSSVAVPGRALAPGTGGARGGRQATPVPSRTVALPISSGGPTTCTVFENNYGTQIVVDSPTLDVRHQCLLWTANRLGVGYLWGYERSARLPTGIRLCSLSDPDGNVTASVIDNAALVPGAAAARTRGMSVCAGIAAAGWTKRRSSRLGRRGAGADRTGSTLRGAPRVRM